MFFKSPVPTVLSEIILVTVSRRGMWYKASVVDPNPKESLSFPLRTFFRIRIQTLLLNKIFCKKLHWKTFFPVCKGCRTHMKAIYTNLGSVYRYEFGREKKFVDLNPNSKKKTYVSPTLCETVTYFKYSRVVLKWEWKYRFLSTFLCFYLPLSEPIPVLRFEPGAVSYPVYRQQLLPSSVVDPNPK
jgi:hypothetical protein